MSDIEKAVVSVPVPRLETSIYVVGRSGQESVLSVRAPRRERYPVYYEMYRKHPTVRTSVEKLAKVAMTNGYTLVPVQPGKKVPVRAKNTLTQFFRRSHLNQLLRVTFKDILVFGESFWLIVRDQSDRPLLAKRLHPQFLEAKIVAGQPVAWVYGDNLRGGDTTIQYKLEDVVHFKLDDPDSDIYGLSILDSLQQTVANDLFAVKFNTSFFENAAHVGIVFKMKNATKEEGDRNRQWLDQEYVGAEMAHRALLLEGDIDVDRIIDNNQEMQFIEGRKFNRQEILSAFDIDPTKVGISETSNRSVGKEADNTFRSETIEPLQLLVEDEINDTLIAEVFQFDGIAFKLNAASKRDMLEFLTAYQKGEQMGAFSPNEIAVEFGNAPVEGGDVRFIQTAAGLIPLSLIEKLGEKLVAPTPVPAVANNPKPPSDQPQGDDNPDDQNPDGQDDE